VTSVTLTPSTTADLHRFAADSYPDEGCGVLVGRADGGDVEVVEVTRGRNLVTERSRDRYELDPRAIVAAERSARGRGLDIVGFWHTHPDHPARPSGFDTERAWPEYVYVICAVTAAGVGMVRAFRLEEGGGFVEVPMRESAAAQG
jgi:proteasome lid subunit RPN8/RPN11